MLKSQYNRQEDRDSVMQSIEWCCEVLVLLIEWPNVRRYEVQIVLLPSVLDNGRIAGLGRQT